MLVTLPQGSIIHPGELKTSSLKLSAGCAPSVPGTLVSLEALQWPLWSDVKGKREGKVGRRILHQAV